LFKKIILWDWAFFVAEPDIYKAEKLLQEFFKI